MIQQNIITHYWLDVARSYCRKSYCNFVGGAPSAINNELSTNTFSFYHDTLLNMAGTRSTHQHLRYLHCSTTETDGSGHRFDNLGEVGKVYRICALLPLPSTTTRDGRMAANMPAIICQLSAFLANARPLMHNTTVAANATRRCLSVHFVVAST